jgi:hypothetical protein
MNTTPVVVKGVVKPDGTLELESPPELPVGPVEVIVRALPQPAQAAEGWWPYLQRIRAEREAAGYHFLNEAEMRAHLDWLRDDEERMDRLYREIEQQRQQRGPS